MMVYRQKAHLITEMLVTRLLSQQALAILLLVSILVSLFVGAYALKSTEVLSSLIDGPNGKASSLSYLIWHIRLPRILLSILVGIGLAAAGAAIQGLFRNPLADPALIGVTSGAMVFAVLGILLSSSIAGLFSPWLNYLTITIMAFFGSLVSTLAVYRIATISGFTSVNTMLLAGIAITALCGALTGLMSYFSDEDQLRDITFWTLGSMGGANWHMLAIVGIAVVLSTLILLRHSSQLDLLLLGEKEAHYMGVDIQRVKRSIVICAALCVGVCVAMSGVIAFIALAAPHLIRLVKGPSHRNLISSAALMGAIILLWSDTIARTIIAPAELPIGILTALLGAPFFIWLIQKTRVPA